MRKLLIQQGYSIIELMIALLLGSILLLGVTQMMITSSTLGTSANNLLSNQDVAKTTLDLLGSEARRAGYNGCTNPIEGLLDVESMGSDKDRYAIVPFNDGGKLGIKFRYGVDGKTVGEKGKKLVNKDCLGKTMYYREMIYQNCEKSIKDNSNNEVAVKEGLCVSGGTQPDDKSLVDDIVENVRLSKIVFTVFYQDDSKYKIITVTPDKFTTPLKDIQSALLVTFYIDVLSVEQEGVKDKSATQINRSYSVSYSLRNL